MVLAALALLSSFSCPAPAPLPAQRQAVAPAPPRKRGEGPFERLWLRGGTLIDGTGAPPIGPVDLLIEGNRIVRIQSVGFPGVPIRAERRTAAQPGDREIDCHGRFILPGFVDMHGHIGGSAQGTSAEYVFKLWLAHGITTVRDPACGNGVDWVLEQREQSAQNRIAAPRIHAYVAFGMEHDGPISKPEQARDWIRSMARRGVDGFKFFGAPPDVFEAALREAKALGLRSACHHAQMDVARANVLDTARWGLTTMEHWYGLPEAMLAEGTVQNYPLDYNYNNEQHRFGEAGRLWRQAAPPHSPAWNRVMDALLALDFTLDPTFTIYEATRDLMRARCAEWHPHYTLPSLWDFFRPNREAHGSFWFSWNTGHELAWKENYRLWMKFVNEYKNRGGRVTTGSDCGYLYKLYGFGYVRELELLQEAGFHPLEVIRSATLHGAEALGMEPEIGSVEVGKLADLLIVEGNPLQDFKILYGTGAIRLDQDNQPTRLRGLRYTIKDGIVYETKPLLQDVRNMVADAWKKADRSLQQPGLESGLESREQDD
ncbi:MAG: amidohydrolase [Planctomycetota bacterium]|nr:MAG: amidohydrolase [Planctomycetota bacterium]